METIWFGFLFGIGFVLAVVLWRYVVRFAIWSSIIIAVLAIAGLCAWFVWANFELAAFFGVMALTWVACVRFDRFLEWCKGPPLPRRPDYLVQTKTDLEDAGYNLPPCDLKKLETELQRRASSTRCGTRMSAAPFKR